MKTPTAALRPAAGVLLAGLAIAGCAPAPTKPAAAPAKPAPVAVDHDHDHAHDHAHDHEHDEPGTLAEGIARLDEAVKALGGHLAADSREAADEAVHALGHLMEDVQGLVGTSELAADAKAAATKALDDLFDCFGKLDEAFHAEPGKGESPADVHASIAKRVEEAVTALRTAAETKAAAVADDAASIIEDAERKEDR